MVDRSIIDKVRQYLGLVRNAGVDVALGVIYGSVARGEATPDSDIDLLVLAPEFDRGKADDRIRLLWRLRQYADSRIEPIAVGVREFEEDDGSPLIGVARRDGVVVSLPTATMVQEGADTPYANPPIVRTERSDSTELAEVPTPKKASKYVRDANGGTTSVSSAKGFADDTVAYGGRISEK